MKELIKKNRLFLSITAFIVLILTFVFTIGSLFFLADTPTGAKIRESLGLSNTSGLNIQTTRLDKIVVEESSAIIDANKKVGPSVVSVINTGKTTINPFTGAAQTQQSSGTGFIVTSDGLIATNKHVVSGGEKFQITTADEKTYDGRVVATDLTNDLAFIKIEARGLPVAELGDSDKIQVGQWVVAIGNALGELQNSVNVGVVSGMERTANPKDSQGKTEALYGLIQTDAAINPGNSGGPLLNLAGQVIGINTAIADAQNIGFAIPSNDLKKDLESYTKNGKILVPYIGVHYQAVTKALAKAYGLSVEQGAWLVSGDGGSAVVTGSPAAAAGLRQGDVITYINKDKISESQPLTRLIRRYEPGVKINLTIIRDGKEISVEVTLGTLSG